MFQSNMQWGWGVQSDSMRHAQLCNSPDGKECRGWSTLSGLPLYFSQWKAIWQPDLCSQEHECCKTCHIFFSFVPQNLFIPLNFSRRSQQTGIVSCLSFFSKKTREEVNKVEHAPIPLHPSLVSSLHHITEIYLWSNASIPYKG